MKTYEVYEVKTERGRDAVEYAYDCVEAGTEDAEWYATFCESLGTVEAESEAETDEAAFEKFWEEMRS